LWEGVLTNLKGCSLIVPLMAASPPPVCDRAARTVTAFSPRIWVEGQAELAVGAHIGLCDDAVAVV
jgi:hypothetical protein